MNGYIAILAFTASVLGLFFIFEVHPGIGSFTGSVLLVVGGTVLVSQSMIWEGRTLARKVRPQGLTLNALAFAQSISLRASPSHRGRDEIRTVEDGIALLFRSEVSEYRIDSNGLERSTWTDALYHLSTAKFDRTPESVERARGALHRLAGACGIAASSS